MGGGQANSGQASTAAAQQTAANTQDMQISAANAARQQQLTNTLFGNGSPGSTGTLSGMMNPANLTQTGLNPAYQAQFNQGLNTIGQSTAQQRGQLAQSFANSGATGNSTPTGFQADQMRQLGSSQADQQGQLYSGLIGNLFALPSQERDAHLFGEWDSFIGQFFSEFQRRLHVCKPFQIPSYWERFASFDWGFRSPACTLWHAVSPEGRVYTYREAYVKGKDTPWLAQNNVKLTGNETLRYKVGDPACFNNTAGGPTVAEVMAINGWAMLTAENDRKNGWARVRDYLAWEENDHGQLTREPTWQIFDGPGAPQGLGCPNLIRTLPALVHDPYDPEDVNSDCEDHAPDTARYGLMTRPRSTIVPLAVMDYEYREATQRAEHDEGRSNSSSGSFYSD
jgi:hypothetical protein